MSDKNNKADGEKVELTKAEYETLKTKAAERDDYCDKYLRSHAEFENAKKRFEKERIDLLKYANEVFILSFLPIRIPRIKRAI